VNFSPRSPLASTPESDYFSLMSSLNIFWASFIIYITSALFFLLRFVFNNNKLSALGLRTALFGFLVQSTGLGLRYFSEAWPWLATYLDYYQLAAWTLALGFLLLGFTKKFFATGALFVPLIVLFSGLSLLYSAPIGGFMGKGHGYLIFHLTTIFLSLALFSICFVTALLYLISDKQIRSKKISSWSLRLPSLATTEAIHSRSLVMGYILLTLSIITGAGYAKMLTGNYLSNDPKQWTALGLWLFFAVLINFRSQKGWQGHRGILLSLIGLVGLFFLMGMGLS
jgi:ABC-type transport system involved in cytochrome c biogenesis permease subunit